MARKAPEIPANIRRQYGIPEDARPIGEIAEALGGGVDEDFLRNAIKANRLRGWQWTRYWYCRLADAEAFMRPTEYPGKAE